MFGDVRQCQIWESSVCFHLCLLFRFCSLIFCLVLFYFLFFFAHFFLDLAVSNFFFFFYSLSSISFKFHDYILSGIRFDHRASILLCIRFFGPLPHQANEEARQTKEKMSRANMCFVTVTLVECVAWGKDFICRSIRLRLNLKSKMENHRNVIENRWGYLLPGKGFTHSNAHRLSVNRRFSRFWMMCH